MKGNLVINLKSLKKIKYKIEESIEVNTFQMDIYTDMDKSLEDIIEDNNMKKVLKKFEQKFKNMNLDNDMFDSLLNMIGELLEQKKQFIDYIDEIRINGTNDDIIRYLDNNPILKTKKIVLNQFFTLDIDNILKLEDTFMDYNNIYIQLLGNQNAVSIEDAKKTILIINNIVTKTKSYNFSPLEQLMYVYDIVRDRIYEEEKEDEPLWVSRDLTSSLLGQRIVCEGYANIFDKILNKLNFKTMIYNLECSENKELGHCRNLVYIQDDKYDVDGVYYFDTTWDNKKEENNNNFLNGFRFFAKTKCDIEEYEKGKYMDVTLPAYEEDLEIKLDNNICDNNLENISFDIIKTINIMSRIIDDGRINLLYQNFILSKPTPLNMDKEEFISLISEYTYLFNKPLKANTLLKVLFEVRKRQYYEEPYKYPFSINDFFKIVVVSNWQFLSTGSEALLELLFPQSNINPQICAEKMKKYCKENKLEENIESIKLAKTLRIIYDKKSKENL